MSKCSLKLDIKNIYIINIYIYINKCLSQILVPNDLTLNCETLSVDNVNANNIETFALNVAQINGLSIGPGNVTLDQETADPQPNTIRGQMYFTKISNCVNFQLVIDYENLNEVAQDQSLYIEFPIVPINPPGDLPFPALFGLEQVVHCNATVNYVEHPEIQQVYGVVKNDVDGENAIGRFELRFISNVSPFEPQILTARFLTQVSGTIRMSGVFFLEQ